MKNNEDKCDNCGNVYEKVWTDEEVEKALLTQLSEIEDMVGGKLTEIRQEELEPPTQEELLLDLLSTLKEKKEVLKNN